MKSPTTTPPRFVVYLRVSTAEQGAEGLGIEAQRHACGQYVNHAEGVIVREFVEVASGDDDDRPKLADAVKLCRRTGATLVVARLDRLSRAVAVIAGMMRQGLRFAAAECANASPLELHLRAIIAEDERRKISERTRDALAAAKRRGVRLGSHRPGHWDGREDRRRAGAAAGSARAAKVRRELRAEVYEDAAPVAVALRAEGASLRTIASELNRQGHTTPRGRDWHAAQVQRLLADVAA